MDDNAIPTELRREGWAAALVIGLVLGSLLTWGALAQLDSGAIAPGSVIPSGRVRTVQHLEGGVIAAIHVKDGDTVRQGQELFRIDETQARAGLAITETERVALEALVSRLTAERDGLQVGSVATRTGVMSVDNQVRLFEARRDSLARESKAYAARIVQAKHELAAWNAKIVSLTKALDNAIEDTKMNRALHDQNFIGRARLLQLETREAEITSVRDEARAELARAQQKITDSELALSKLRADWMTQVLDDLRKAQEGLDQAKEREAVAQDRLQRTRVVAPQEGRVQGLKFTTVGGVVPPGGAILDVVPLKDELVIEARVAPDDIDAVRTGLPCRVRLTAYRARTQIALKAVVAQVSADAVRDERQGITYYNTRVEIRDPQGLKEHRMTLQPGMLAQVEIVTGRRSVLRYLTDPLLDSTRRAFWED
jgi:HlyD family type I secretion membrane fusion protein